MDKTCLFLDLSVLTRAHFLSEFSDIIAWSFDIGDKNQYECPCQKYCSCRIPYDSLNNQSCHFCKSRVWFWSTRVRLCFFSLSVESYRRGSFAYETTTDLKCKTSSLPKKVMWNHQVFETHRIIFLVQFSERRSSDESAGKLGIQLWLTGCPRLTCSIGDVQSILQKAPLFLTWAPWVDSLCPMRIKCTSLTNWLKSSRWGLTFKLN